MIEKQERTALIKALSDTVRAYAAKTEAKLMKWCSDELQALSDLFDQRIKELPEARNGINGVDGINGKDGRDGIDGKDGLAGTAGINGESGRDGRDGINGKDGRDGVDGKSVTTDEWQSFLATAIENRASKWELDFELRAQKVFQRAIDKMPIPKDGKDGRDGFNVEDMTVHHDGDGLVTFTFSRGELTKAFQIRLPRFMDQGVYKKAITYRQGDGVTYDRSYWICQKDEPTTSPAEGSDWRLAVRAGRDGKDGVITQDYIPGPIRLK